MDFTATDLAAALSALYDAFDEAQEAVPVGEVGEFETYYDRDQDYVDGHGGEIVNALLAAGWKPPKVSAERIKLLSDQTMRFYPALPTQDIPMPPSYRPPRISG